MNNDLEKQLSNDTYFFLKISTYRTYSLFGKAYFCDVCIVKDLNKNRIFIRLQKRWFGLSKRMVESGEKKPRWIVISSFNFPQKFEFQRALKMLNDISDKGTDDISELKTGMGLSVAVDEIKKLKNEISDLEGKKKGHDNKKLDELRKKVTFLEQENRAIKKELLKKEIPRYRKILKKAVIDLERNGEAHYQSLFAENHWIFGPAYDEVISKRKADVENQPDFVLKRYDGFSDIVEIESPQKPLFTKKTKSGKSHSSALLTQAVSQAMDYIESYNQKYKELFYDDSQEDIINPIHAYYPKGLVIIGKDKSTDRKKLRQLNNFLHNISVLTYDEFLKQAERMLNIMDNKK